MRFIPIVRDEPVSSYSSSATEQLFYSGLILQLQPDFVWDNFYVFFGFFFAWIYKQHHFVKNIYLAFHKKCLDICCTLDKKELKGSCQQFVGPHVHILLENITENWGKNSIRILRAFYFKYHNIYSWFDTLFLYNKDNLNTWCFSKSLWDGERFKYYMLRNTAYLEKHGRIYWTTCKKWYEKMTTITEEELDEEYMKAIDYKLSWKERKTLAANEDLVVGDNKVCVFSRQRTNYLQNMIALENWLIEKRIYDVTTFRMFDRPDDPIWLNFSLDIPNVEKALEKMDLKEASEQASDIINYKFFVGDIWNKESTLFKTLERAKERFALNLQKKIYENDILKDHIYKLMEEGVIIFFSILDCLENYNQHKLDAPRQFITDFINIMQGNYAKKNCLVIYGMSNSGKSLILDMLLACFNVAYMTNVGDAGTFHFSNIEDSKTVVIGNETYVRSQTLEQWKALMGGEQVSIPMKHRKHHLVSFRRPIFLTSQSNTFKEILTPDDRIALYNRCCMFRAVKDNKYLTDYTLELGDEILKKLPLTRWPHLTLLILSVCECLIEYEEPIVFNQERLRELIRIKYCEQQENKD